MLTNLLSLFSELRNKIYEQLVVHQEPIDPYVDYNRREELTPGLLRTNKTFHGEASSLLYAKDCFNFTACHSELVASFLDQIGRNNAKHMRYVRIDFPDIRDLGRYDVTLEDDSIRILAKIQRDCTNLGTFTTSLSSTDAMVFWLDVLDSPQIIIKPLALIDARFRLISSLQEINVELYEEDPSSYTRRIMESHGSITNVTEELEESNQWRKMYELRQNGTLES